MDTLSRRTVRAIVLAVLLVVGAAFLVRWTFQGAAALSAARETIRLLQTRPSPDLTPSEVIRLQLEAFHRMEAPASGPALDLILAFLSPDQRRTVTDTDQLAAMLSQPPYRDLLDLQDAQIGAVRVADNRAWAPVLVVTADRRREPFVFWLAYQSEGEDPGFWTLEGIAPATLRVTRFSPRPDTPEPAPTPTNPDR